MIKNVVLLPGLDGTGLLFEPFLSFLPLELKVKVISYPTDKILSIEELAQYVQQQVVFDQHTLVLAESFSGLIVIKLLNDKVPMHSVIFCASFASNPQPKLLKLLKYLPLSTLLKLKPPTTVLKFLKVKSDMIELVQKATQQVNAKVLAQRLQLIAQAVLMQTRPQRFIPCYYWRAIQDDLVPEHCANELKSYFTQFNLEYFNDSGHFLLQTQPQACADALLKIIKGST